MARMTLWRQCVALAVPLMFAVKNNFIADEVTLLQLLVLHFVVLDVIFILVVLDVDGHSVALKTSTRACGDGSQRPRRVH